MPELKIGIAVRSLRQPLKKALHTAAQLGAQGVELDARNDVRPEEMSQTGVRQFRKLLEDLNLRTSTVAFPTRRGYDTLHELDRRVDATKAAMKLAHDLGATTLVNQVGRVPDDEESREWQTLVAVLTDLGAYGQRVGTMLAARTGSESAADLQRLIQALPEGAIGVDLDPGRLIVNGFSAQEAAIRLGPYIMHVHANDGVRDLGVGRGMEVQLGRGIADYPALLGALEDHNYRGWFTIERQNAEDPIGDIGDAMQFLRAI